VTVDWERFGLVDRCPFVWVLTLLDPDDQMHRCCLPKGHESDHICECGMTAEQ
jgi:hypothetical protein